MNFDKSKEIFLTTLRRAGHMSSAAGLLYWDMQTVMPKKGAQARAQVLGAMESEVFRLTTSDEFGGAIAALRENQAGLTARELRMVEEAERDYVRYKKIPADMFEEFSVASAAAGYIWMSAKEQNDYETFKPHLIKLIDFSRRFAELWGYESQPYDAMLAGYDPGLLTAQIDPVFRRLLSGTRELLKKAGENIVLPSVTVSDASQYAAGEYLLREIGYDLEAGNLYTTEHPFTSGIHAGDVRVTTKYHPNAPLSSVFSVLHEGGHGIYDQNIDPGLDGTNLHDGASMGIHESQSRLFENMIGRGRAFWETRLGRLEKIYGVRLARDPDEFFRGINAVQPSLIRIEADELTYNLHIIIRYECEKAIFNGEADADSLPELWREKYREYLGIVPETYAEGVMQDSHWSSALFGYFPSYAIGNLCAAQFADAFAKEHGPLEKHAGSADGLRLINSWLKENIHVYGREEKPEQILRRVCGKNVDPEYFLRYMEQKLAGVYGK